MDVIRLSASEISGNIFYLEAKMNALNGKGMPNQFLVNAVNKGTLVHSRLHSRLGYAQTQLFQRYLELDNKIFLIVGMPDKIETNPLVVIEFKTFHDNKSKKNNFKVAQVQVQVYSFITGIMKQRVDLFPNYYDKIVEKIDMDYDKIVEKIDMEYDEKLLYDSIIKAYEIKLRLAKFAQDMKAFAKESKNEPKDMLVDT